MRSSISKSNLYWRLTQLGLTICVIGFSFPIYGISDIGGIKLTFWRLGFVLLGLAVLLSGTQFRSKTTLLSLSLAGAFIIIRLATYVFATAEGHTLQQLFWFVEGFFYLFAVTVLASKQPGMLYFYLRAVFFIGFISIGAMVLQYIALQFGLLLSLPLSTSSIGLTGAAVPWTYPLYGGGRIIGAFYEPNMSGSMCAFYVAAFAPFLLAKRQHKFTRTRWLAIALATALLALFASGSRQALAAAAISSLLIGGAALLRGGRTLRRALLWSVIATLGMSSILLLGLARSLETPFGEIQMNVLTRISLDAGGDATGGRLYWIREILQQMTPYSIIFGIGEGAGILTAHNAFLIVLNQNGITGLLLLCLFGLSLFLASARVVLTQPASLIFYAGLGSTCIVATWTGLIFINWAQLNQSLSFMYLAFPFVVLNAVQLKRAFHRQAVSDQLPKKQLHTSNHETWMFS